MPSRNSSGGRPPPTLWAQFQMETMPPRSFCDHQCTMVRPHGGQPMPWNQPHRNSRTNMMAMLEVAHGTKPMNNITAAARIRPAGRNTRGLERSETEPMMNLEKP